MIQSVSSSEDIENIVNDMDIPCVTCVIASFGLLFSQTLIDRFKQVVNFHPGDVLTCRGRHPLPFAILKKLPLMCITAHLITSEKIDAGPIITQIFMPISYSKSYEFNANILQMVLYGFVRDTLALLCIDGYEPWEWFSGDISSLYNKRLSPEQLGGIIKTGSLREL